uniref:Uncharacterized protein n=1 Tax=Solanum tuberosum TaxID=4113 RepID=M1DCS4_SOLTU
MTRFTDRVRDHSLLTFPWTHPLPSRGGPWSPSWAVDHLTNCSGARGCQAETTSPIRQTTGPFTGRGPDDGRGEAYERPPQNQQLLDQGPQPAPRSMVPLTARQMGRGQLRQLFN